MLEVMRRRAHETDSDGGVVLGGGGGGALGGAQSCVRRRVAWVQLGYRRRDALSRTRHLSLSLSLSTALVTRVTRDGYLTIFISFKGKMKSFITTLPYKLALLQT